MQAISRWRMVLALIFRLIEPALRAGIRFVLVMVIGSGLVFAVISGIWKWLTGDALQFLRWGMSANIELLTLLTIGFLIAYVDWAVRWDRYVATSR